MACANKAMENQGSCEFQRLGKRVFLCVWVGVLEQVGEE
jgi:hypothetical protein